MVTRMHGSTVQAYLGSRDVSGDLHQITPEFMADVHDTTNFGSSAWHSFDAGLNQVVVSLDGWYDKTTGAFEQQVEGMLGIAGGILSVYDNSALVLGEKGALFPDSMVDKKSTPRTVADLVHLNVTLKPMAGTTTAKAGMNGKLFLPKATYSATATGSALNNAASSANGGRGTIHILTVTGSPVFTVKLQSSPDNSTWTDLMTFTAVTAVGVETKEVSGTVDQYLRSVITKTSGTSFVAVMGFARY